MKKVRDHGHLTEKYCRAAHFLCKLNYILPGFIPVFLHNLGGNDAHLFIKQFIMDKHKIKIKIIPHTEEKYK